MLSPAAQALAMMVDSRMCSREATGSASMPTMLKRLVT